MIDIKYIRENSKKIEQAAKSKNVDINVEDILEQDKKQRDLDVQVQSLREKRNKAAREKNIDEGKKIKEELDQKEEELRIISEELKTKLLQLPNVPKDDVKVGKDESENEVIKTEGAIPQFNFTPKDHLDLGEALDIVDVKRAAKVSGTRFAYLKGDAVLLEFALVQLALETLIAEGFTPIVPPVLINQEITEGLGYWQNKGNEDYYLVSDVQENKNYYLIGTAEHAIVPMFKDEVLNKKDLPRRFVGFSSAFRREAGSYGKDTKGILRVHQFDKVEMVSFTTEEDENKEYDFLLSMEEKLFQLLEIPYQVIKMCTGDLGFPAAAKKDIEAWMPGQNKYREVTSVSQVTDFQSRRLNIKYQDGNEKKFARILNGTGFAIGRTIIAILENYQQEDGSINVPKVLQKYLGKEKIVKK